MIFRRFYDEKLAQASYLIGCAKTGEAAVIDAHRHVETYIEAAAREGLRIIAVTETHIHADYVSGSRELADRTGARLFLSDEGDENWKYAFADQPNVTLVRDGDQFFVGNLRLDVWSSPGHTPEHITFVLYDLAASLEPQAAFTGDFIFVGDVGRPDLLERAAGVAGTMEAGGRRLFDSLRRFVECMPDTLLLWPAHGSGSACGKSLGGVPVSTLGYERTSNWGLQINDREEFVQSVLADQPEPPFYFKEMKRINKVGPSLLGGFRMPSRVGGSELDGLMQQHTVVDIRPAGEFSLGHLPGMLNIPMGRSFTQWAGWMLNYDRPVVLLADSADAVAEAVRDLQMIGIDDVPFWVGTDALLAYALKDGPLGMIQQMGASEAASRAGSGDLTMIDVRGATEFKSGAVPKAINIPLGYVRREIERVPTDRPIAVICEAGGRSPIGASLLRSLGFEDVVNVPGGIREYAGTR